MRFDVRLRFWYGLFLSALTVVVALLFIAEAADLYYGAADGVMYSRAIVEERLAKLAIPFALWALAALIGYGFSVLYPALPVRPAADKRAVYRRLRKRLPAGEGEAFLAERNRLRKSETARVAVWTVAALFAALAAVMSILYLADSAHFTASDLTAEIFGLVNHVAPWVGASFALFLAAALYDSISIKYETERLKCLLRLGNPRADGPFSQKRECAKGFFENDRVKWIVRIALGVLAVLFLVLGIVDGGARDVLYKAVNICKECIGLG